MLNLKIIVGSTRPGRAADQWIRAVEHLAHVAVEAELVPLRNAVVIPYVSGAFGPDGGPADDRTHAAAKNMLDDLAWWAAVLQRARLDGPLPPAIMRAKGAHS